MLEFPMRPLSARDLAPAGGLQVLDEFSNFARHCKNRTNSPQIWQLGRSASHGIFPNGDVELMNFFAIMANQALDDCCRNSGFVQQRRGCPTQTVKR